jgi:cell division septation protein DedD
VRSMRMLVLLLAIVPLLSADCAKRRPPVRSPADLPADSPTGLPTTMPSEEEAARVRPGAPEAIPAPAPAPKALPAPPATQAQAAKPAPPPIMAIRESESRVTAGPPTAPVDSLAEPTPADSRPGYRVQLFATADPSLAQRHADEYRTLFTESIHIRKEDDLYKIQAGDCATREEADRLRRKARALGYTGAFVVEAPIPAR